MGHVVFILLHLATALFFIGGLLVTIPAHLIYAALASKRDPDAGKPRMRCPHCAELVLRQARICKHCGRDLRTG